MRIEDQRGWIILNTGIPVFPTLLPTRTDCVMKFRMERGISVQDWRKALRIGLFECVKVQLVFD